MTFYNDHLIPQILARTDTIILKLSDLGGFDEACGILKNLIQSNVLILQNAIKDTSDQLHSIEQNTNSLQTLRAAINDRTQELKETSRLTADHGAETVIMELLTRIALLQKDLTTFMTEKVYLPLKAQLMGLEKYIISLNIPEEFNNLNRILRELTNLITAVFRDITSKLESMYSALNNQVSQVQAKIDVVLKDIASVDGTIKNATDTLTANINAGNKDLTSTIKKTGEATQQSITTVAGEVHSIQNKIDEVNGAIGRYESALHKVNTTIGELKDRFSSMENSLTRNESAINEVKLQGTNTNATCNAIVESLKAIPTESVKDDIIAQKETLSKLETSLNTLTNNNPSEKITQMQSSITALQSAINEANTTSKTLAESIKAIPTDNIKADITAQTQTLTKLETSLKSLTDANANGSGKSITDETLKTALGDTEKKLNQEVTSAKNEITSQISELKKLLESEDKKSSALQKSVTALETKIKDVPTDASIDTKINGAVKDIRSRLDILEKH